MARRSRSRLSRRKLVSKRKGRGFGKWCTSFLLPSPEKTSAVRCANTCWLGKRGAERTAWPSTSRPGTQHSTKRSRRGTPPSLQRRPKSPRPSVSLRSNGECCNVLLVPDSWRYCLWKLNRNVTQYIVGRSPGSSEVPRNPLTRWDVSSIPANGIFIIVFGALVGVL